MADWIEIDDISRPELDVFARLTEAQLRSRQNPEKGIFIAESPKVIELALDAGYELSLIHIYPGLSCSNRRESASSESKKKMSRWLIT